MSGSSSLTHNRCRGPFFLNWTNAPESAQQDVRANLQTMSTTPSTDARLGVSSVLRSDPGTG